MPECLSLVWGHLVHLAEFLTLRLYDFRNATPSAVFIDLNQTSHKISLSGANIGC